MGSVIGGSKKRMMMQRLCDFSQQLCQEFDYQGDPGELVGAMRLVLEGKFGVVSLAEKLYEAIESFGGNHDDLLSLVVQPGLVEKTAVYAMHQLYKPQTVDCCLDSDYFTPILDAEVPEQYQSVLAKYRTIARTWGIADNVAICYRVRAGFTLKQHAPKFGECKDDFNYLQSWNFFKDVPTIDCLIFWIPCVVPDSMSKTCSEQIRLLSEIRTKYELPAHHLTSLGTVAENSGLILAHKRATGELIPLSGKWIRTATSDAFGRRLELGDHDASGLDCGYWNSDENRLGGVGVFVQGVEVLGR